MQLLVLTARTTETGEHLGQIEQMINWTSLIWTLTFVQFTHDKYTYCSNDICAIDLCSNCCMFKLLYVQFALCSIGYCPIVRLGNWPGGKNAVFSIGFLFNNFWGMRDVKCDMFDWLTTDYQWLHLSQVSNINDWSSSTQHQGFFNINVTSTFYQS